MPSDHDGSKMTNRRTIIVIANSVCVHLESLQGLIVKIRFLSIFIDFSRFLDISYHLRFYWYIDCLSNSVDVYRFQSTLSILVDVYRFQSILSI